MLDKKLLGELKEYVNSHLKEEDFYICESPVYSKTILCNEAIPVDLEDFVKKNQKPTFNQILFSFIDKKGVCDIDIYKKAGIDRRHFSKIRSNPDYHLGKNTAIALALALELNRKDTDKLLNAAGFSLSGNDLFDLVIQFCLEKKIYDVYEVNQALGYFSLKPLVG